LSVGCGVIILRRLFTFKSQLLQSSEDFSLFWDTDVRGAWKRLDLYFNSLTPCASPSWLGVRKFNSINAKAFYLKLSDSTWTLNNSRAWKKGTSYTRTKQPFFWPRQWLLNDSTSIVEARDIQSNIFIKMKQSDTDDRNILQMQVMFNCLFNILAKWQQTLVIIAVLQRVHLWPMIVQILSSHGSSLCS
jgi:hypothetical protein